MIWLTGYYHIKKYSFSEEPIMGGYGMVLWPLYWFIESLRLAAGLA
jgi:hypothetical protein